MRQDTHNTIQFINVSHPDGVASSLGQVRISHAHAARTAHASKRRLRTAAYQASLSTSDHVKINEKPKVERSGVIVLRQNVPDEVSLINTLTSTRQDPFSSFVSPLKTFEHFLLDHYLTVVAPWVTNKCTNLGDHTTLMFTSWVHLALSDYGFLHGIFLESCRHLAENNRDSQSHYARLAVDYKYDCMRTLIDAIGNETSYSDATVAKVLTLAVDEYRLGNLEITRKHVQGAVKMVEINGGLQTLGLDGFLGRIIEKIRDDVEFTGTAWCLPRICDDVEK